MEKIEGNLAKLEERLAHEKEKFAQYDVVLKEHETRCVDGPMARQPGWALVGLWLVRVGRGERRWAGTGRVGWRW